MVTGMRFGRFAFLFFFGLRLLFFSGGEEEGEDEDGDGRMGDCGWGFG